ncbi:DUF2059 domain-containing protein [Pedobacter gandavensis]|uniref:DUF2059 domain-containing protein n=1 Tax=Pedobacter gandavensis TaxID=2679963 RepID=A0ABR6F023_9SPHI|nr:DUF2059 domain-containing protein [Pedobacter gandavensis]MBB2150861.1 DUF2059 domain-containing protein [Pedobacter gandavensis]
MKNNINTIKKPLLVLALLISTTMFSFGQDNNSYKASLKEMMNVSGSTESYKVAIAQTIKMLKTQKSNVPESFWLEFEETFSKSAQEDLFDLLLPIYEKHITEKELKDITKFYSTPTGKKFAEKTPFILRDSMEAGQQWGMKLGEQLAKKMQEKGY